MKISYIFSQKKIAVTPRYLEFHLLAYFLFLSLLYNIFFSHNRISTLKLVLNNMLSAYEIECNSWNVHCKDIIVYVICTCYIKNYLQEIIKKFYFPLEMILSSYALLNAITLVDSIGDSMKVCCWKHPIDFTRCRYKWYHFYSHYSEML